MSVNIDREKLASIFQFKGTINNKTYFSALAGLGYSFGVHCTDFLVTKKAYADLGVRARYTACGGVSTGGAYMRARDRYPKWIENVYTCYWAEIAVARATTDFALNKTVAGVWTVLGWEAVDLTAWDNPIIELSVEGSSIHGYRFSDATPSYPDDAPDAADLKINVTDTSIASGAFGFASLNTRYNPSSYPGALPYLGNAWIHHASTQLTYGYSTPPEAIAFFEVPIVGSGKIPHDKFGNPMPIGINQLEDYIGQIDPFRIEMPEDIVEVPQPISKLLQRRKEVLKAKKWSDEEIKLFMPEAYPVERVNRLALTHSNFIPTDKHGKPVHGTAILRVFASTPEPVYSMEKRIEKIKEMHGAKRLKPDEAADLALKMDDKLHIHDLKPCSKHDLGGQCWQEYHQWRLDTYDLKEETIDPALKFELEKRYVKETKSW